jgi:hypothetical protein
MSFQIPRRFPALALALQVADASAQTPSVNAPSPEPSGILKEYKENPLRLPYLACGMPGNHLRSECLVVSPEGKIEVIRPSQPRAFQPNLPRLDSIK